MIHIRVNVFSVAIFILTVLVGVAFLTLLECKIVIFNIVRIQIKLDLSDYLNRLVMLLNCLVKFNFFIL